MAKWSQLFSDAPTCQAPPGSPCERHMSLAAGERGLEAYQQPVDVVVRALGTEPERGLSEEEARARLGKHGPNQLTSEPPTPGWKKFVAQFNDALVILLVIATAISTGLWLYERDTPLPYEAMAICAVVLLNAIMGYLQEARAESAVAALRGMAAAHAHVVRGGERRQIDSTELVPGDLLLIEEGDTIGADARVL